MSKHNNRNASLKRICNSELAINTLCSKPLLHLYSDKELIIEGVNDLDYYDEECVRIAFEKKTMSIKGKHLCIKCLANMNLSVSGIIENVSFEHLKK